MTEPKKRGLFQLHLSTCIVLMFVAACYLWFAVWYYEYLSHNSIVLSTRLARVIQVLSFVVHEVLILTLAAGACEWLLGRWEQRP
ncbi:MAG TPA: hypothetical protein VGP72_21505 [Planctomycetota bacterium]|jgi:hypothetical protein